MNTEQTPKQLREQQLVNEVNKIVKDYANSNSDLRDLLSQLTITKVREFAVTEDNKETKKALLIFLPFAFHKNQPQASLRLLQEIQKKKDLTVFMTAQRTVVHPRGGYKQKIPRSRTLTSVYESLLSDLVAPSNILGKRIRHKLDGTRVWKVQLNEDDSGFLKSRLAAVESIYVALTKRTLGFEFMEEANYTLVPKPKKAKAHAKKRHLNRKDRRTKERKEMNNE